MAKAAEIILSALDRHLPGPAKIRLMGGAALTLAYGMDRATEDADLLLDDEEARFLAEQRGFGDALEKANRELEPLGLYVSHIWGPEQQILTPRWKQSCRAVPLPGLSRLTVESLGPLDIIVSKLARADEGDLEDIRYLIASERLSSSAVRGAVALAQVPSMLKDVFPESVRRLDGLLRSAEIGN